MQEAIPLNDISEHQDDARATRWISHGFEKLVQKLASHAVEDAADNSDFDVVIIGSGYGGAMAAAELAGCRHAGRPVRVCVLERGVEYLSGMFPSRMADIPGHVRCNLPGSSTPKGRREGLFDLRVSADVSAIVANGLGGGSLINAGVMEQPLASVFDARWPEAIRNDSNRDDYYARAKSLVGASEDGEDNSIEQHAEHRQQPLQKYQAAKNMATDSDEQPMGDAFRPAAISIAMRDKRNAAGVDLKACKLCGDCVTGCNHGAKDSLDVNLLYTAARAGAEIYTGASVLRIEQIEDSDAWCVQANYTDKKLRKRQNSSVAIRTRRIVLAAGTLGSNEILQRSASNTLKFSPVLGSGFSTNGDMLAAAYSQKEVVNAIANEQETVDQRRHGPCITGIIDLRQQPDHGNVLIEELAVPGPLQRVFEEVFTTAHSLHALAEGDGTAHAAGPVRFDPFAINDRALRHTSIFAVMGDDGSNGRLRLEEDTTQEPVEGAIRMLWPALGQRAVFKQQIDVLQRLTSRAGTGGRIVPNPLWRLVPHSMRFLLQNQTGPLLTVHPLGGCGMADDINGGVVDSCGRVFDGGDSGDPKAVHPGLVVLDGSIVPTALGTNPALSIAALTLRAVEHLRQEWKFDQPEPVNETPPATTRPVYREVPVAAAVVIATEVEVIERLAGEVVLTSASGAQIRRVAELTLYFDSKRLDELTRLNSAGFLRDPVLRVSSAGASQRTSMLRLFQPAQWQRLQKRNLSAAELEAKLNQCAEYSAPLMGSLTLLSREQSGKWHRLWRALPAWCLNRGLRDTWQWFVATIRRRDNTTQSAAGSFGATIKTRLGNAVAIAFRAGEVRLLEYELQVDTDRASAATQLAPLAGIHKLFVIRGVKRLTYSRRCNPWRQLCEMTLTQFPGLRSDIAAPVLSLDTNFLARQGIPLLRIVKQQDQITALADLFSLGNYFLRLLLSTHIWSFRKPEQPPERDHNRLPGQIRGLPKPVVKELTVGYYLQQGEAGQSQRKPIIVRLTRFANEDSPFAPVVMLHGYSASGTSFAHHAVQPNLASYCWHRNRDVWIVDMRTSAGMPTARHPWTFEEAALTDIPEAFDYIFRNTGERPLDVVAHCMGSAMFSMAVLSADDVKIGDKFATQRRELPQKIRSAVLSQVGPAVVFSQANIIRTYAASYLKNLLPLQNYAFRSEADPSLGYQLLDRLLATLPYPDEEFDIENPGWRLWRKTDFVGTRHRMDALYGRDFSLANVAARVLEHIDDLFGPLNIDTVSQAIHFAKLKTITDRDGRNVFLSRHKLQQHWRFPTLCVHGEDNGLADVATLDRMQDVLQQAGCDVTTACLPGFGHQDCLIGREAEQVFEKMHAFLNSNAQRAVEEEPLVVRRMEEQYFLAVLPASGPVLGRAFIAGGTTADSASITVGVGLSPTLGTPLAAVFLPVSKQEKTFAALASMQAADCAALIALTPDSVNQSGWLRLDVPARLYGVADQLLVLLVYQQLEGLESAAFGEDLLDLMPLHTQTSGCHMHAEPAPDCLACENAHAEKKMLQRHLLRAFSSAENLEDKTLSSHADQLAKAVGRVLCQPNAVWQSGLIDCSPNAGVSAEEMCFAFGSCQYPGGLLDRSVAYASYQRLANRLDNDIPPTPGFLLLAGDQIYVDATADLFDPTIANDRYVRPYHRLYRNRPVREVLRRLPSYAMLDDHEIDNNWEGGKEEAGFLQARSAYFNFQRGVTDLAAADSIAYQFEESGFPFFILDTRTERTPRSAVNLENACLIGNTQFLRLEKWLGKLQKEVGNRPKFIVSPAMLLPRHRQSQDNCAVSALRLDGWDGYPRSLQRLLSFLVDHKISNVIFLSGDEHLSCVATAHLGKKGGEKTTTIHSIHSSALYAPFPFANAIPEDLLAREQFDFDNESQCYTCDVTTEFVAGDGFALLNVVREHDRWVVNCEFDRVEDSPAVTIALEP